MTDSHFSSLIYRIIGKPERWHDDYIVDMMQQYLDQSGAVQDPSNTAELAAGDQIISSLQQGNVALNAFNTLLDKSRFQLIILDEQYNPLYHNESAYQLFLQVTESEGGDCLKPSVLQALEQLPQANQENQKNSLIALNLNCVSDQQVYLRSLHSAIRSEASPTVFHILMALDSAQADLNLNPDLVARYGFSKKEQAVLLSIIQGRSIQQTADSLFVSPHTIKSHLKSLYGKTNTNSQTALSSLVLTHESQLLDSYFDSDITTNTSVEASEYDRVITLSDGLKVAYCDYGPSDGRVMLVFHSGFGSRLAIPSNHRELCQKLKRRVIVIDRPGLGKTPFVEGHPQQWNAQLNEFIDLAEIQEYDLLGSIIACQLAMSFAAQADSRLKRVILTSPVFLNTDEHCQYLTEILAPAAKYVRLSPQFAREIYELWLKSVTLNLEQHYPVMLAGSVGSAEREQFERDKVIELLTRVFKEGARTSLDGILNEMVFCMTPLNLDLANFHTPVEIWYGTEDKRITHDGVEQIAKLLPKHQLHICEGYSEHIYYSLFEKIAAY